MGMNMRGSSVGQMLPGVNAPPNSLAGPSSLSAQQPPLNINFGGARSAAHSMAGSSSIMQGIEAPPNSLATGQPILGSGPMKIDFGSRFTNPAGPLGSSESTQGIEAPPNSLAVPSSTIGQFVGGSSLGAGGPVAGFNPPPNTPARPSTIAQYMSTNRGSSSMGGGQVPTGSFIDRRIRLGGNDGRLSEADEDDRMGGDDSDDQEMGISPASFQNPGDRADNDPDMFPME
ncbi:hypothetical protein LPJ75_005407 [Coemansia sp. RSA 2598]|nr:hypothetical protein LPJ75_005407 [Coemansia sp. RSA 2598]